MPAELVGDVIVRSVVTKNLFPSVIARSTATKQSERWCHCESRDEAIREWNRGFKYFPLRKRGIKGDLSLPSSCRKRDKGGGLPLNRMEAGRGSLEGRRPVIKATLPSS